MATILEHLDFTDVDSKSAVKKTGDDWVNSSGDNVYLAMGGSYGTSNGYYGKLLRDYGINPTDAGLANPVIFQVKEILICFVEIKIFQDLIQDSRAPFETQSVLTGKYQDKLKEAKECLSKWLKSLDENAFFDKEKGTDTPIIGRFGRG